MGIRAGDVFSRNSDGSFEITPCDADQAGIVSRKRVSHWLQSINQSSEHRTHGTLMPNAFQQCRLSPACHSGSLRHIGGLVPAEHGLRCVKIVNLGQSVLQLGKDFAGRLPVDIAVPPNASGTCLDCGESGSASPHALLVVKLPSS